MKLDDIIKEYNKDYEIKARLVSKTKNAITIEMRGKSQEDIEDEIFALRGLIEAGTGISLLIQSITKSTKTYTIKFSTETRPADDIVKILRKYDEGTEPRTFVPEE